MTPEEIYHALHEHFGAVRISGSEGGMHVLWRLSRGMPTAGEAQVLARSFGVGVYPLANSPAWLYEHVDDWDRILLLGYTSLSEEHIARGVARLAAALAAKPRSLD